VPGVVDPKLFFPFRVRIPDPDSNPECIKNILDYTICVLKAQLSLKFFVKH
jgi:hypothetical protein